MATASNDQMVAVVIEWLDAMRRGDRDALAECFRPDATWRGIMPDAVCHDRAEVLDMLEHRLAVGVRSDDLRVIADVPAPGAALRRLRDPRRARRADTWLHPAARRPARRRRDRTTVGVAHHHR
jgi:ketosteroid isomerase-like protein